MISPKYLQLLLRLLNEMGVVNWLKCDNETGFFEFFNLLRTWMVTFSGELHDEVSSAFPSDKSACTLIFSGSEPRAIIGTPPTITGGKELMFKI